MHMMNASHTATFTAHRNNLRLCKSKINHSSPRKIVHHCPKIGTVMYMMNASHTATFTAHRNNLILWICGINHSRLRKLYDNADIGIFLHTIYYGLFICSMGIRIYRLKAAYFHLSIAWICGSLIPISVAVVAAPIRKRCALYLVGSSPAH